MGHVPLIEKNLRGREVVPIAPHEIIRFYKRTASERFNIWLKEELGGKNVRILGNEKVKLHLKFEVIAFFADQFIKLIGYGGIDAG